MALLPYRLQAAAKLYSRSHALMGCFVGLACRCDTPAVRAVLGSEPPSDKTLLQYLGVVEVRVLEVLHSYMALSTEDPAAAATRLAGVLHGRSGNPLEFAIDPPSAVPHAAAPPTRPGGRAAAGERPALAAAAPGGLPAGESSDLDRPLDRAVLAQRAQRAVEGRLESALKVKIRAGRQGGVPPSLHTDESSS